MDGWFLADPRTAAAILAGRKTQLRVPLVAPLARLQPGARIGVREACVPGRLRDDGAEVTTALPQATHVCFPDGARHARNGETWQGRPPRDAEEQWLAAIHMPEWACRLILTVDWTREETLQAITRADLAAEGWHWPLPRRAFARHWNTVHTTGGTGWSNNPLVLSMGFSVG